MYAAGDKKIKTDRTAGAATLCHSNGVADDFGAGYSQRMKSLVHLVAFVAVSSACDPAPEDAPPPSAFAAGSGWTTQGQLPGDGTRGVDGTADLNIVDLAERDGVVHALWSQTEVLQQGSLTQFFDAPLTGDASPLTTADFGGFDFISASTLGSGFAEGEPAVETQGAIPSPGIGADIPHSWLSGGGINATVNVTDYFTPYVRFRPSFEPEGLFVMQCIAGGSGAGPASLSLKQATGTALSELASGAAVNHGLVGAVAHVIVDGVTYVAWDDEPADAFGSSGFQDGELVVARVDGTAFTELGRVAATADTLSVMRQKMGLVVDGDRFVAIGLIGNPPAVTIQELSEGASPTSIPLNANPSNGVTLAVHGARAVVGFSDLDHDGKATVLELDGDTLTPLGTAGFTKAASGVALRFVGDSLYVAAPNFNRGTLEIGRRD